MARKTAKDYQNELQELQRKEKALENRIRQRTLELCKQYPDIVVLKDYLGSTFNMTAGGFAENMEAFKDTIDGFNNITSTNILVIESIEKELAARHPHKQTEIDF